MISAKVVISNSIPQAFINKHNPIGELQDALVIKEEKCRTIQPIKVNLTIQLTCNLKELSLGAALKQGCDQVLRGNSGQWHRSEFSIEKLIIVALPVFEQDCHIIHDVCVYIDLLLCHYACVNTKAHEPRLVPVPRRGLLLPFSARLLLWY